MNISFENEVFTEYDLDLLRSLCQDRKELHKMYRYPRREQQALNKCIRLIDASLSKLAEKRKR